VAIVVRGTPGAVLLSRSIRAAVRKDDAVLPHERVREVGMGAVDAAVQDGDGHTSAGEPGGVRHVAADEREALGVATAAPKVEVDPHHVRSSVELSQTAAGQDPGHCGDRVPVRRRSKSAPWSESLEHPLANLARLADTRLQRSPDNRFWRAERNDHVSATGTRELETDLFTDRGLDSRRVSSRALRAQPEESTENDEQTGSEAHGVILRRKSREPESPARVVSARGSTLLRVSALKVISAVFGTLASRPAVAVRPQLQAVDESAPREGELRIAHAYPSQAESAALLDVYLRRTEDNARTTLS